MSDTAYELESMHASVARIWERLHPLHPNEKGLEISQIVHARLHELEVSNESAFDQLNTVEAELEQVKNNRDMWKGQCERQADKLRAHHGEEPTDDMARALSAEYRKIWPGGGRPALSEAKRLIRAAIAPETTP